MIPASTVAILASLDGSLAVCRFQWFLAVVCFLVTLLTLITTAAENYSRLCASEQCYEILTPTKITCLIITYWIICSVLSGMQFIFDINFDYCTRKMSTLLPHQATIAALALFMPIFLTFCCYIKIVYQVRAAKARPSFKPPVTFQWDYSLMKTNLYSLILFISFWLPFCIVLAIGSVRDISAGLFYNLAWLALSKSCFNNFLYCICNRHFRNAYVNLFHYCCCKTTVSLNRRPRGDGTRPSGDVRVHIIPGYNMYSYTSPQRGNETGRHSGGKRCGPSSCRPSTSRPNGRDVYEL